MKKLEPTCMLNRILNALSKGLSNMDTIAWLTAIYIAIYVGVIVNENTPKEPPREQTKVEQQK